MLTFGKIPSYQGTEAVDAQLSDDRRAIDLHFSDFVAHARASTKVPVVSRLFNFVLPLEGDAKTAEIEFVVDGHAVNLPGASATLLLSVNGQSAVTDLEAGADHSFQTVLKLTGEKPAECRISVVALAGRDSTNADSESHLSVSTVSAEVLPRPK